MIINIYVVRPVLETLTEPMTKFQTPILILALLALLVVPIWPGFAGLGVRFDLWSIGFGLGTLTREWWTWVRYICIGLGALTLLLTLLGSRRRITGLVIGALAIAVPIAAKVQSDRVWAAARSVPAIHDITTDREDPPMFTSAIMTLRDADNVNPANYVGKVKPGRDGAPDRLVSDLQAEAYPDIIPIELEMDAEAAFQRALTIANSFGWKVESESPEQGLIEATDTTFWYGFKDDVIIRIRATETGSLVDIRSISRIGGSDLGKNASRIRAFRKKLLN